MRRLSIAVILAAFVAAGAAARQAPPAPDRLSALQREAESLARQERTLLGELRQFEVERDLHVEQMRRAEAELADVANQRAQATSRIAVLEGQVAAERPALAARLVELYKLGRPGYVRLLFDADGVHAATRAYRTVTALIEADRLRVSRFRATLKDLHDTERLLAERSAKIQELQAQAQQARQAAERAVAGHNTLIAEIDARRDLNAQLMGELQAAQQKLAALSPAGRAAVAVETAEATASRRGAIDWPAPGRVSAHFGAQQDARFGATMVHEGIEIEATAGMPATCVDEGVVTYAEPFTGFGNLVIVDHGRQAYSLYGFLDSVAVSPGTRVERGHVLGTIGHSPAGKPGLYFELRIDGKAVDPVQWLKKQ